MNIQLFLEGREIELTSDVVFPLNREFQHLYNPADIIVEYSKSINIPMTAKNNETLCYAYNLTRVPADGGNENIGLYLDPYKKISCKLLYNNQLMLEGYAKYTSAYYSKDNKYYTINLYGQLGEIFQKLKDVVVDEKRVADGDLSYVLNDHCSGKLIDRDYVVASWVRDEPPMDINDVRNDEDIIGMAPSYRGFYNNFKSDSVHRSVGGVDEIISMGAVLEEKWKDVYAMDTYSQHYDALTDDQKEVVDNYVDKLEADKAVGDGLKDYQMNEYRSYQQRPFIYFNKLMQMYQEKCKELTGYELKLDPSWFNANNPYWTRSCYMFDFLNPGGTSNTDTERIATQLSTVYTSSSGDFLGITNSRLISVDHSYNSSELDIAPFTIDVHHLNSFGSDLWNGGNISWDDYMRIVALSNEVVECTYTYSPTAKYVVTIKARPVGTSDWQTKTFWSAPNSSITTEEYTAYNYTPLTFSGDYRTYDILNIPTFTNGRVDFFVNGSFTIPTCKFTGDFSGGAEMMIQVMAYNPEEDYMCSAIVPNYYEDDRLIATSGVYNMTMAINSQDHTVTCGDIDMADGIGNNPVSKLRNIYKKDEPLFDVILQYTKMFQLVWDVDYNNQTLTILPRGKYFDGYTIEDWGDKMDKSRDYIVEPVSFPTKYIGFNYDDVDGFKYKDYKDKYGVNYGAKKVKTKYEFNNDTNDIFSGLYPSISSNRSFIKWSQLYDWDLEGVIKGTVDRFERPECASKDDKSSVQAHNWSMRGFNVEETTTSYISDDSNYMITNDKYCYYDPTNTPAGALITSTNEFPVFSPVYEDRDSIGRFMGSYCMLFNQPQEDYTEDEVYAYAGKNYVYDRFWENFINERYNSNNKKLTAYFYLTPEDYMNFKFNKFVYLHGSLFCVNKIYDHNINDTEPTKIDLIQITDPTQYASTGGLFPAIYTTNNIINGTAVDYGATIGCEVRCYPRPYVTIIKTGGVGDPIVYIDNFETYDHDWYVYNIQADNVDPGDEWEGYVHIESGEATLDVPVTINSPIE